MSYERFCTKSRDLPDNVTYHRINVAVRIVSADMDLVFGGLLVDRVVKVDSVGVLQLPVSPQVHGSKAKSHQTHEHFRRFKEEKSLSLYLVDF